MFSELFDNTFETMTFLFFVSEPLVPTELYEPKGALDAEHFWELTLWGKVTLTILSDH